RIEPIVTALLLVLLVVSDARARDTWFRIQTKNFTVISNGGEGDARKVALKLEQFRNAISIIFPKTKLDTPIPTTVILFNTDDAFRPFKPRVKGKIEEEVGGYFLLRRHMNYIVLEANNPGASP